MPYLPLLICRIIECTVGGGGDRKHHISHIRWTREGGSAGVFHDGSHRAPTGVLRTHVFWLDEEFRVFQEK